MAVRRAPPVYPATPRPCASRKPWRFDVCRVPLPANVCRIPPAVRSTVARSPCNRGNRSTLARLNRAENGLASRPPLRPCPRPSEMRRAFCKPSATVCNAISASRPAGSPASVRRPSAPPVSGSEVRAGFRPMSAATVRASGLSAIPATSNAPRPVSLSGNAATVRQSQAVATVRATIAGNAPQPPALAFLRAGRVRARPAVPRPCKAV